MKKIVSLFLLSQGILWANAATTQPVKQTLPCPGQEDMVKRVEALKQGIDAVLDELKKAKLTHNSATQTDAAIPQLQPSIVPNAPTIPAPASIAPTIPAPAAVDTPLATLAKDVEIPNATEAAVPVEHLATYQQIIPLKFIDTKNKKILEFVKGIKSQLTQIVQSKSLEIPMLTVGRIATHATEEQYPLTKDEAQILLNGFDAYVKSISQVGTKKQIAQNQ